MLLIVFIVLKLTDLIAWSWWWVLSPLWMPMALIALAFVAFALVYGVLCVISGLCIRMNNRRFERKFR